jgi:hypothetical protein
MWTALNCPMTGTSDGLLGTQESTFGSHEMQEVSLSVVRLPAAQTTVLLREIMIRTLA